MVWQYSEALNVAVREVQGEPIAYERGGVSSDIVAAFDAQGGEITLADGTRMEIASPMLGVRVADLPDGKAMQGDTWVANGVRYRVVEVMPDAQGWAKLIGVDDSL